MLYVINVHVISWPQVKIYVGLIICDHSMNGCVGYVYGLKGRGKQFNIWVTINEILLIEPL